MERCLSSLIDEVDGVIVVDGAYQGFPWREISSQPYSTDDTFEITTKFCDKFKYFICLNELKYFKVSYESETVKRNRYIEVAKDYWKEHRHRDIWLFQIDADETLQKEKHSFLKNAIRHERELDYRIELRRPDINPYDVYRIFKLRPRLRYFGTHHCLVEGTKMLNKMDNKKIEGFHIDHKGFLQRSRQRQEAKGKYYEILKKREGDFRAVHSL